MNKSAQSNHLKDINASDTMKEEYNKVKQDCNLMAKLTDMKSKIDLLQKELNYELQQLELVKKQSAVEFSHIPHIQAYPPYSSTNFGQSNLYANHPMSQYWYPGFNNYYQNNPYMFGYENRTEAHTAFSNSLEKADKICNNEIKNTAQDICKLKTIRSNWRHQPFNNMASAAGDDLTETAPLKKLTTIYPPINKSQCSQQSPHDKGRNAQKLEDKNGNTFDPEDDSALIEGANVKRAFRTRNLSRQ